MLKLIAPLTQIDTSAAYTLGSRTMVDEKEYVYLKGVASTIVGSWVTYDEAGTTTLLVADAKGPVGVAMAITDSTSKYGWYQIWGSAEACIAANTADNGTLGYETTAGYAGDGRAAGDQLVGAIAREATTDAAVVTVQLNYPYATDALGS